MSSVAPSAPEQGQLVSVRSRQWIVTEVAKSTLPAELPARPLGTDLTDLLPDVWGRSRAGPLTVPG